MAASGVRMKIRRIGLAALALVLLAGCSVMQQQKEREAHAQRMNELVGKSVDDLVKAEGPPTSTFALKDGGTVFEYSKSRQVSRGGGSMSLSQPTLIGSTWVNVPQQHVLPSFSDTLTCRMLVAITPARSVESWKQDGRGC